MIMLKVSVMHTHDEPGQANAWRTPEIIEVGAAAELTQWDPQYTLRDNQGSTPVKYKVGTEKETDEEVDLGDQ